ncbi:MAG: hypothetical protein CL920_03360 [Deltaproteobacteria bacterium]|nr:hypothetical protein [Deltaproteobacteria bacterium]MBU47713.1 hypothetical protein [Deltaproteobacteria bacterium]
MRKKGKTQPKSLQKLKSIVSTPKCKRVKSFYHLYRMGLTIHHIAFKKHNIDDAKASWGLGRKPHAGVAGGAHV